MQGRHATLYSIRRGTASTLVSMIGVDLARVSAISKSGRDTTVTKVPSQRYLGHTPRSDAAMSVYDQSEHSFNIASKLLADETIAAPLHDPTRMFATRIGEPYSSCACYRRSMLRITYQIQEQELHPPPNSRVLSRSTRYCWSWHEISICWSCAWKPILMNGYKVNR